MRTSLLSLGLFALIGVKGQTTSSYSDSNTGITFERYYDDTTGFSFGMALPEANGSSDFIAQMVMKTNGTGYCGVTMSGEMTGSMIIAAWPNDDKVVHSLRETSGYTSPGVFAEASNITLSPITNGTFVNTTHMSYTFLCGGCITGDSYSFDASSSDVVLGWAVGDSAVTNPASSDSATFTFHQEGYGEFGVPLASAKSAYYNSWASMATISNSSASTLSNSSTCSTTSKNVTATVSNSTYDYIIAGAGPAGLIVAERLAESGKSVLLVEQGKASYAFTGGDAKVSWNSSVTQYDVPAMSYYLETASDTSEYCTDTASMAGCILGGGTMVNALMFVRPQEADFNDKWPTGWKWDDVSASAEKLYQRNPGTTLASKDGKRYDQGAYNVLSTFFAGLGWNHVDSIESPNSKTQAYSYPAWDIVDGLRAGPLRTYYPLAQAMSNFKLSLNTKVIRAVRNGTTMSGIEVETSAGARQIINVKAGGKVILAAGTMSTPRLLLNSGIGPTDQINIVKNGCTDVTLPEESAWIDLPVGQNLKDHPIFTLTFNTTVSNATSLMSTAFVNPNSTEVSLFSKSSGPLVQSGQRLNFWTSLNTTNGTRYFQGTCNSPAEGQVRIKLYLTHGATSSGVLGITNQGATEFSTNPWMNTDEDKTAVATMIDYLLNAARNSSVISYSDSTATGADMIKTYTTGDHFVGTAKMSLKNDGTGVVDTNTKVWGTDNLFVVDASIHPDLPTGNTQAIIMVAAEMASSKILALSNSTGSGNKASSSGNYTLPNSIAIAKASHPLASFAPTSFVTATATAGSSPLTNSASVDNSSPTTIVVLATSIETIYSCAASVTNCPARGTSASGLASIPILTTHTRAVGTSVVPVSDVSLATSAIIASAKPSVSDFKVIAPSPTAASVSAVSSADAISVSGDNSSPTTIVVLATSIETIYSCAASVTNCPASGTSASGLASIPVITTHTRAVGTSVVPKSKASIATSAIMASAPSISGFKTIVPSPTAAGATAVSSADAIAKSPTGSGSSSGSGSGSNTGSGSGSGSSSGSGSNTGSGSSASSGNGSGSDSGSGSGSSGSSGFSGSGSGSESGVSTIQQTQTSTKTVAQSGTTTLTILATTARVTTSAQVAITVYDTVVVATTICPVTEAESATSAAFSKASATGFTNIGAIQVATTASSATAVIPSITAFSSADAIAASEGKSATTTLTVLATSARTTKSGEAVVTVYDTVVVATTVCPVTEAESASSAAIANATGLIGIGAIQAISTPTASSNATASATAIPSALTSIISSVGGNSSSSSSSVTPMPTGTTLEDVISWLYQFLTGLKKSS